jgi:hypothetical protein
MRLSERRLTLKLAIRTFKSLESAPIGMRVVSARRMRSVISRVFRYAIATARAQKDVAADLCGALITPKVKHLAAITTATEAGALMRAIDGYDGHGITAIALRLSPHLFVRPGELRQRRMDGDRYPRSGLVAAGVQDEDAPPASCPIVSPSRRDAARVPRAERSR